MVIVMIIMMMIVNDVVMMEVEIVNENLDYDDIDCSDDGDDHHHNHEVYDRVAIVLDNKLDSRLSSIQL